MMSKIGFIAGMLLLAAASLTHAQSEVRIPSTPTSLSPMLDTRLFSNPLQRQSGLSG